MEQKERFELIPMKACPLCAASATRTLLHEPTPMQWPFEAWDFLNAEPLPMKQCKSCSFGFTGKLPPAWFFDQVVYNPHVIEGEIKKSDQPGGKEYVFDHALELFRKHGVKGPLLDVGCANGRFLWRAKSYFGSEVEGIELHHRDAEMARSYGFTVHEGNVAEILSKLTGKFGVLTMIDVLEHLPEPGKKLQDLSQVIRRGGHIYIKVPHLYGQVLKEKIKATLRKSRTSLMTNFAHINHFTETSLCRALENMGFEIVASGASPSDFNTSKGRADTALRIGFYKVTAALSRAGINAGMHLEVLARRK
jgi:hypothetical protein